MDHEDEGLNQSLIYGGEREKRDDQTSVITVVQEPEKVTVPGKRGENRDEVGQEASLANARRTDGG